jgi:hypothetical protein
MAQYISISANELLEKGMSKWVIYQFNFKHIYTVEISNLLNPLQNCAKQKSINISVGVTQYVALLENELLKKHTS